MIRFHHLLFGLFTSCAPIVYAPNIQHIPELTEAGDISILAGYGGSGTDFFDLSAAYAVSSQYAVMLSGNYGREGNFNFDTYYGEGIYIEPAFGYYNADHANMRYSLYGAFGSGRQRHFIATGDRVMIDWNRFYLQPGITFKNGRASFTFSSRLGHMRFGDGLSRLQSYNPEIESINNIRPNSGILFAEPAVTIAYGWEQLKLNVQLSRLFVNEFNYPFHEYYLGLGLSYTISTIKK